MKPETHISYMRMALQLAKKAEGATSPNPMVGAVLVKNGRVVGKGYHKKAGGPHAEIFALRDAGKEARGADMYVTLEPCCHHGKTGPCVDAITEAGVRRVFAGMQDPNPKVCGNGFCCLENTGIDIRYGILEEECRRLNERFIKYMSTGRPFVVLKGAMTLDGVIASKTGDSKWITGEQARKEAHRMRSLCDAVLVGAGTVLKDDPSLTVRSVKPKNGQPLRVVLDSSLRIGKNSKLLTDGQAKTEIFTTSQAPASRLKRLESLPGVTVTVARSKNGHVSLKDVLARLGRNGIQSVLIEGGSQVHASALAQKVVDRVAFFYAPKIMGGADSVHVVGGNGFAKISQGWNLKDLSVKKVGADLLVEGYIKNGRPSAKRPSAGKK